ncbi:uncharacterized protein LOC143448699 [Clavelina lepadiformis]|uniref:uncharacterized protein LOC143448699 n=1 Tax=Clavelina lepadiformis TaxID=159417 RepID=UPI0040419A2A
MLKTKIWFATFVTLLACMSLSNAQGIELSLTDSRCPPATGFGTCAFCPSSGCGCGRICCPNGCGTSCMPLPLPSSLECLTYTDCFPLRDCDPARDCPGVPGARCTHDCNCRQAFLGCDGELLSPEQCNPVPVPIDPRCPEPSSPFGTCGTCPSEGCGCGKICCSNGCGSSCVSIPNPPELDCLHLIDCLPLEDCVPERDCPGHPGARCSYDCDCGKAFIGCDGQLLTDKECNPGGVPTDPRCEPVPDGGFGTCGECPLEGCGCGRICCSTGCGTTCSRIPLPSELNCLTYTTCAPLTDCVPKRDCPGVPGATCTHDCSCRKAFLGCDGELLTDEQCNPGPSSPCLPGVDIAYCFVRPCRFASCPAVPNAKCTDDYCGGCNAVFVQNDVVLTPEECECRFPADVYCFKPACQFETCPNYPEATCRPNRCNLCTPVFTYRGFTLTKKDCHRDIPTSCPSPVDIASLINFQYSCTNQNQIGSVCTASCTNGRDIQGARRISCNINGRWSPSDFRNTRCVTSCPPGSPVARCTKEPCLGQTCPAYPEAVCENNYCGGCNFDFFLNGRKLSKHECQKTCPSPSGPDPDLTFRCTNSYKAGSVCRAQCPLGKDIVGDNRITCIGDSGKWAPGTFLNTKCEESFPCPPGVPQVRCLVPPCKDAKCPAHPDAECRENYCGGCHFDFFLNESKLQRRDCIKQRPCVIHHYCQFLCYGQRCNGHPDAICKVDCNCRARFYDHKTLKQVFCFQLFRGLESEDQTN